MCVCVHITLMLSISDVCELKVVECRLSLSLCVCEGKNGINSFTVGPTLHLFIPLTLSLSISLYSVFVAVCPEFLYGLSCHIAAAMLFSPSLACNCWLCSCSQPLGPPAVVVCSCCPGYSSSVVRVQTKDFL